MKKMQLTILVEKGDDGWLCGQIKEYPPVISQGKTMSELKENLKDALKLFLEYQNDKNFPGLLKKGIKEKTLVFQQ
jgi:predicted RNase H-like HicB family nuclease